jgi:hypothetical protein
MLSFGFAVASDQVEIKGLSILVLRLELPCSSILLGLFSVVFQNSINGVFSLNPIRSPFSAHQAY